MYSVLGGIIAILLSLWAFFKWWYLFADVFKGVIPIILLFFGIAAIISGAKRMRQENNVDSDLNKSTKSAKPIKNN